MGRAREVEMSRPRGLERRPCHPAPSDLPITRSPDPPRRFRAIRDPRARRAHCSGQTLMTWQSRLRDLIIAGGTLTTLACSGGNDANGADAGIGIPCGNANSDPCICGLPDSSPAYAELCTELNDCLADGGEITSFGYVGSDGGVVPYGCGPADAASSDAPSSSDAGHDVAEQ